MITSHLLLVLRRVIYDFANITSTPRDNDRILSISSDLV